MIQGYKDETNELLDMLESDLLELEAHPDDTDLLNSIFRSIHTIKGGGGVFGFDEISRFAHHVENVFDRMRSGEIHLTPPIFSASLSARDHIRKLLDHGFPASQDLSDKSDMLIEELLFAAAEGDFVTQPQDMDGEGEAWGLFDDEPSEAAPAGSADFPLPGLGDVAALFSGLRRMAGIPDTWEVVKVRYRSGFNKCEVVVKPRDPEGFACPACGAPLGQVGVSPRRVWLNRDFFGVQVYLVARIPLGQCPNGCAPDEDAAPWEGGPHGFALLM